MLDPAILVASFAAVKKAIAVAKDVEGAYKQIATWMDACHQVEKSHEKEKNKLFNKSVTEEALSTYVAAQNIKKQREELRLWFLSQNPQAWNDFLRIEANVRKVRQQAEIERKRRIQRNIEILSVATLLICLGVGLWLLVWWALHLRGLL
jgi:DNA helicase IV